MKSTLKGYDARIAELTEALESTKEKIAALEASD